MRAPNKEKVMAKIKELTMLTDIWHDKIHIAKAVNATVISLDDAPRGYQDFDKGAAKKFVIDPHGLVKKAVG
jgi:glutathione-independent formaldehyde dehydrogenase